MTRKLYLVPILHLSADMGSLGPVLNETARAGLGQVAWQKHQEAVIAFWNDIAQFFNGIDAAGMKVYQDGMVADGADGLRILRVGISQGSKNYEIIENLLERGAVLVKTEDLALVKQEYTYLAKIAKSKSLREKEVWSLRYKLAQGRLLGQRDEFIARRINETLGEGETGILFIGAYHDVLPGLANDIQVIPVKDIKQVRAHHRELLGRATGPASAKPQT
ncbi:MAG: hypothetical protein HY667_03385 [Chloroflexi bacterium]|nr:hypothetical protein [Chloroflexota bacterium]